MSLQKLKDAISLSAHGMTKQEAHAQDVCVKCKELWWKKTRSNAGKQEYQISGLCEECFDNITKAE